MPHYTLPQVRGYLQAIDRAEREALRRAVMGMRLAQADQDDFIRSFNLLQNDPGHAAPSDDDEIQQAMRDWTDGDR